MSAKSLIPMLHKLRTLAERLPDSPSDAELLSRFVSTRDEAAFEVLVWRHGAMVYRTCRSLLSQDTDAEDAFQTTFLLLSRDAGSIHSCSSVAAWLHRVAMRTANRLRQRLPSHEALGRDVPGANHDPLHTVVARDEAAILMEEIDRLPLRYRETTTLCLLQGRSSTQAAIELQCPPGTIHSRLAWARQRLRERLTRRRVAPAVLAALLTSTGGASALPSSLVSKTMQVLRIVLADGWRDLPNFVSRQAIQLLQESGSLVSRMKFKAAAFVVLSLSVATVVVMSQHDGAAVAEPPLIPNAQSTQPDDAAAWRLASTLETGKVPVNCLLFSPSGNVLAANGGSAENTQLGFWQVPSGRLLHSWSASEPVRQITYSADGKLLAAANQSGAIFLFDASTGKQMQLQNPVHHSIRALVFSGDGKLYAGTQDGEIQVWRPDQPDARRSIAGKDSGPVDSLVVTGDGKRLVSAGSGMVRVWDTETGREAMHVIEWDRGRRDLSATADGKLVAIARLIGVTLFDTATGKVVRRIEIDGREVAAIAVSPDGKLLAVGCNPFVGADPHGIGEIRFYDVASGNLLSMLKGPRSYVVRLAFSPDGRRLAVGGHDGRVYLWDKQGKSTGPSIAKAEGTATDRFDQLVETLANSSRSHEQCIEALFLAVLGRFPEETERKFTVDFVSKSSHRRTALRGILFSLTNTREFQEHMTSASARCLRQ